MENSKESKDDEAKKQKMETRQHNFLELRLLDQQIKELQEQMQMLEQQNADIVAVQEAIDEIKAEKQGKEMLVPIAGGIFIKAKMGDTSTLLLNVGGSTVVEKTPEQAKELLEQQRNEIANIEGELTVKLHEMVDKAMALQAVIREE